MRAITHYSFAALLLQLAESATGNLNLACAAAALAPDIDHPKSTIGLSYPNLASFIKQTFYHRTITHSIFALLVLSILSLPLFYIQQGEIYFRIVAAYSSHIIIDMFNERGVFLFWPLSKKEYGCRYSKIRVGSKTEYLLAFSFVLFFASSVLLTAGWKDFNKNISAGLYPSYELAYKNYTEYSPNQCFAEIEYFDDSEKKMMKTSGIILHMNGNDLLLFENRKFIKKADVDKILITKGKKVIQTIPVVGDEIKNLKKYNKRQYFSGIFTLKNLYNFNMVETASGSVKVKIQKDLIEVVLYYAPLKDILLLLNIKEEIEREKKLIEKRLPLAQISELRVKLKKIEEDMGKVREEGIMDNMFKYKKLAAEAESIREKIRVFDTQSILFNEDIEKYKRLQLVSIYFNIKVFDFD